MIGTLTFWNGTYGFIETKTPEPIGIRIDRYFLHACRINLQPTSIRVGQVVRFTGGTKRPGKLPFADSAEIFETMEQLQAAEKAEAVQS